jgi:hypothetical protein
MSNPLAEDYFRWLVPQIRDEQSGPEQYWDLYSIMFEKEFVSLVPNDDNRMVDGTDLRAEFCYSQHIRVDAFQELGPCSFLEVLIGLSRRLSFAAGGTSPGWAWQLVINLELDKMSDPLTRRKVRKVDYILETVIRRTYDPDGCGGFFPLAWPDEDQTQKELWYQMAAYIDELHPGH